MAVRRHKHNMSHYWSTGLAMGNITPFLCQEVVPGDSWRGRIPAFVRSAPLARPTFSVWQLHMHVFFVPHRIVWDGWEDFITNPDSTESVPTVTLTRPTTDVLRNRDIGAAFGVHGSNIFALPFRAYNLVWNEFFRDQELDSEVNIGTSLQLLQARYGRDYFSSLRSEVQVGDVEAAPVVQGGVPVTGIRDAMHRQRFREHRSQFGSRYHDYLAAMGVSARDSRLDRPEHCSSHRQTVGVSEVLATADSSGTEVGDYKGHGVAGSNLHLRKRFFAEHGTLLGLAFVRPRNQIRRRVDRMWLSSAWEDWYHPELATDTQVGVVAAEIRESSSRTSIFGYTARDEWLRRGRDVIAGTFDLDDMENQSWVSNRTFTAATPGISSSNWNSVQPSRYANLFQETSEASYRRQFRLYVHNNLTAKRLVGRRPK